MAQVVRTTNELIINSLYMIGELGVGEPPDTFMLSTGLEIINELLAKYTADGIYIPYLSEVTFTMVASQATYSFSDILGADVNSQLIVDLTFANYSVTSDSQDIIYPLKIINKAQYFNVTRLDPFDTRPGVIFLDKQAQESFVTVYPAPDQGYICTLGAKLMLNSLEANSNLADLPPYYYGFLKFSLARQFRSYYPSANWTETNEADYQDYVATIKVSNERDMTIRPSVILDHADPFYWQNILAF